MARRRSKSWYISRLVRASGVVKDEVINVTSGTDDSDAAVIAQLKREADSDAAVISSLASSIQNITGLDDSDLTVVANLRNDITALQSSTSGVLTDSDYTNRTNRVYRISSTAELNTLNQNAANGAATGGAKTGDIAFITHPFKAYVLTNITGPLSGYTNTGFVTNSQTGPSSTMSFKTIPPGQTVQGSFAVGQQIAKNSGGSDARVIATVGTNTITTTQGTTGYPNEFSQITIYARSSPLTTWQPFSFDSDMIKDTIKTFIDSESATISGINSTIQTLAAAGALDSDNVTSIVRADTEVLARTSNITSNLDSDIQGRTNRVYRMSSTSELTTLNQNSASGAATGVAKVGDIAYVAQPFKAFVLTNINGPLSGYTDTGFVGVYQTGPSNTISFQTIPPGQTVQGSFSPGQQIARSSGGGDARVIATVNVNSINTTVGFSGYANEYSQKTIFARTSPLTTWQPFGFDSDQIKTIITENSSPSSVDSDVAAVSELRRDVDSDSVRIQSLYNTTNDIIFIDGNSNADNTYDGAYWTNGTDSEGVGAAFNNGNITWDPSTGKVIVPVNGVYEIIWTAYHTSSNSENGHNQRFELHVNQVQDVAVLTNVYLQASETFACSTTVYRNLNANDEIQIYGSSGTSWRPRVYEGSGHTFLQVRRIK